MVWLWIFDTITKRFNYIPVSPSAASERSFSAIYLRITSFPLRNSVCWFQLINLSFFNNILDYLQNSLYSLLLLLKLFTLVGLEIFSQTDIYFRNLFIFYIILIPAIIFQQKIKYFTVYEALIASLHHNFSKSNELYCDF